MSLDDVRAKLAAAHTVHAPIRTWRREVALITISGAGLIILLGTALGVSGNLAPLISRVPMLILLSVLGGVGTWVAIAPGRAVWRAVGIVASVSAAAALVLWRATQPAGPESPGWTCTVTHLGVAIVPFVIAMSALKRTAPSMVRAVMAGASIGTVGAIVGELACAQSWQHVLVFHLSAWISVVLAAVITQSLIRNRSFAP